MLSEPIQDNMWPLVRIYRGGFLLIEFLFLLGINTYGWRQAGVNHVLIFELNPRNNLSHQHLFEANESHSTAVMEHGALSHLHYDLCLSFIHCVYCFADRRLSRCAVVYQYFVLPLLSLFKHPNSCLSSGALRLLPALPHQPLQDMLLQIPLLAPQASRKNLNKASF